MIDLTVAVVVWNWRTMKPLPIEDVIDMRYRPALVRMMRMGVQEDLGEEYVFPDYAKNWPHNLTSFWLDHSGIVFECLAGELIIGGHGYYETRLSWDAVRGILQKDFVLPTK